MCFQVVEQPESLDESRSESIDSEEERRREEEEREKLDRLYGHTFEPEAVNRVDLLGLP